MEALYGFTTTNTRYRKFDYFVNSKKKKEKQLGLRDTFAKYFTQNTARKYQTP